MKTPNEIERLAEETLKSIDKLQSIESNSFLFTRIEAQLEMGSYQQNFAAIKYLSRLSVVLMLFIVLNALSFYLLSGNENKVILTKKSTAAEALATEYNLSGNQYNY